MATRGQKLADVEARYVAELKALRSQLAAELADIDGKLRALGALSGKGAPARAGRGGRRGKPLRVYIEEALAKTSGTLSAKQLQESVLKNGYKTTAKNLYIQVLAALRRSKNVRRVKRGRYALRGSRGGAGKSK